MYIMYCSLLFLSIIGVIQIYFWIKSYTLKPNIKINAELIIPLKGHIENIEQILRYYSHNINYQISSVSIERIIIRDDGMDNFTREICKKFEREHTEIYFYHIENS